MENVRGRLDVLLLRIAEKITQDFERETGLQGVWSLFERQALFAVPKLRKRKNHNEQPRQ